MSIEKDKAYAEVLRQLSTAELLDRYRQTTELEQKIDTGKLDPSTLEEGKITLNGVQMSVNDARDYLIMQLVKRSHVEGK